MTPLKLWRAWTAPTVSGELARRREAVLLNVLATLIVLSLTTQAIQLATVASGGSIRGLEWWPLNAAVGLGFWGLLRLPGWAASGSVPAGSWSSRRSRSRTPAWFRSGKRTGLPPEPSWGEKVVQLHDALEQQGIPYAFGGAIALNYHREPRSTLDIDIEAVAQTRRGQLEADYIRYWVGQFLPDDDPRLARTNDALR